MIIPHRLISCLLVLAALALSGVAGCARNENAADSKTPIKVACWGTPDELRIITEALRQWETQNPTVQVKIEHTNYNDYVSKILTSIAGGTPPDIIFTEVDNFVNFYEKDALLSLSEMLVEDMSFDIHNYFPEVVGRFMRDGKVYCIPRDTAPFACVFYNKDLFDEAKVPYPSDDWDWKDLLKKAQALTKSKNGIVQQYGFYAWAWQNFVYSNGGGVVDNVEKPTRCTLAEPKAIEGIQFYADLVLKHRVSPSQTALQNLGMQTSQMFMGGKLAMFASGIWETPGLRAIKNFQWDVAMFPAGPDGKRGFGTGGSGYCILKSTKHPKEAWQVVKALSGEFGQRHFAQAGLAQPANRLIADGPDWAGSDAAPRNKKMLNEAVKYVTYNPFHSSWRKMTDLVINPELDLVYDGAETAETAMCKIAPKIDRLLKE